MPAIFAVWAIATLCPAADNLYREAKTLKLRYSAELGKLAAWCDEQGLAAEVKKTRDLSGQQDPHQLCLPILPQDVGPPKPPADSPPSAAEWHRRLLKMRLEQATALYDLARRALRKHQSSLAYWLVVDVIASNPDHEAARRIFGYQKYANQWHTPYEIRKLRAGLIWHQKFGWISKADVAQYEQGKRLVRGRWITAKEDARLHADIRSGWEIETEHYWIRTDHSIEAGVSLGTKLDNLYRLWQQIFVCYYASDAYVAALFAGKPTILSNEMHRFDVTYFRNRDEYIRTLRPEMPDIGISQGLYLAKLRTAYFFAGGEDTERVTYHEATHQLFHESRAVSDEVGRRANFWLVEGIAMYMESLHREDGYFVLGGLDDVRMESARYHLFKEDFYVPFAKLTAMGMEELQSHPKIARLYSQIAAMTNFLVYYDDGRYREALVAYLSAVYNGNQNPRLLAELTGADYSELDKQYREFMKIPLK